jgi:type IV pilus biogenesis protein CpaD/CtpE
MLPFIKKTVSAGIPLTVKSLASIVAGSTGSVTSTSKITGGGGPKTNRSQGPLVITEQGPAVSEAALSRNAMMAMINVVARVIFTFRYHFVVAVPSAKKGRESSNDKEISHGRVSWQTH